MSGKKGAAHERALENAFHDLGFETIRAGGSGSGTDHERPDLLVGNGDVVLAVEAKYRSDDLAYIQAEKVSGLFILADAFNAIPTAAAKFSSKPGEPHYGTDLTGWYLKHVNSIPETPSGNLSLKRDEFVGVGIAVESFSDPSIVSRFWNG